MGGQAMCFSGNMAGISPVREAVTEVNSLLFMKYWIGI